MTGGRTKQNESTVSVKLFYRGDGATYKIWCNVMWQVGNVTPNSRAQSVLQWSQLCQPFTQTSHGSMLSFFPSFWGGRSSGGQRRGTETCKSSDVDISVFDLCTHGLNKETDKEKSMERFLSGGHTGDVSVFILNTHTHTHVIWIHMWLCMSFRTYFRAL